MSLKYNLDDASRRISPILTLQNLQWCCLVFLTFLAAVRVHAFALVRPLRVDASGVGGARVGVRRRRPGWQGALVHIGAPGDVGGCRTERVESGGTLAVMPDM